MRIRQRFHRDNKARTDGLNLLQKSTRRKEKQLAHQATKTLLQEDHLQWHHIVNLLFEDHCLSDTEALKFVFDKYQRGSKQDKFSCIDMMVTSCKTSPMAKGMALSPSKYLPSLANNMALCRNKYLTTSSCTEEQWGDIHPSVEGLVVDVDGCINVGLMLTYLIQVWERQDWNQVIACMNMALIVIFLEVNREITGKGEEYILPKMSQVKSHFTLIVLSTLYYTTNDEDLKRHLHACYNLATVSQPGNIYMGLLLFSIVARCTSRNKVDSFACPDKCVHWTDVKDTEEIPDWASLCHVKDFPREKMMDICNPFFHEYEEECKKDTVYVDHVQVENTSVHAAEVANEDQMHRRLDKTMKKYTEDYSRLLYREYNMMFHGELGMPTHLMIPKHLPRKRKRDDEPEVKLLHLANVYVTKQKVVKGPYANLYTKQRILFSNDCLCYALQDQHAIQAEEDDSGIAYLGFHITIHDDIEEFKTSGISRLHNKISFEELPPTFWAHLMFKYALEVRDCTLHNGVVMQDGEVKSFGFDITTAKRPTSLTDLMLATPLKKKVSDNILEAVSRKKREVLELLRQDFDYSTMKALSVTHCVYFDKQLFNERIQYCTDMVEVL